MSRRLSLPIAHPCPEVSRLRGDGPVLHCDRCDAPVHDLSALTRAQAEDFLHRLVGRPKPCLRYHVDGRGEIRFRPESPRPMGGWVAAAAGAALALASAPAAAAEPVAVEPTSSVTAPETETPTATAAEPPATARDTSSAASDDPGAGCPLPVDDGNFEQSEPLGGVPPDDHYYGVGKREHRKWRRAERRRERRERRAARRGHAVT